jgi:hypothetical protein
MAVSPSQPVFPPIPGREVLASWGDSVSDAVVQRFGSTALRDSQWPNPPKGAVCTTTNTSPPILWCYDGTRWNDQAKTANDAAMANRLTVIENKMKQTNFGFVKIEGNPTRAYDASSRASGTEYTINLVQPAGTLGAFVHITIVAGLGTNDHAGWVAAWPYGLSRQTDTTVLNFAPGDVIGNTTLMKTDTSGRFKYMIFQGVVGTGTTPQTGGRSRFIVDILGWIVKPW